MRLADGQEEAKVEWRRLSDPRSNRVLLGFGHAMTIDAAQGLTSDEHINAMPRGSGDGVYNLWRKVVHEGQPGR